MSVSRSCKKKFTPVAPLEDFAELFKIITFLLLIPVALNKGLSICGDPELCVQLHYITGGGGGGGGGELYTWYLFAFT